MRSARVFKLTDIVWGGGVRLVEQGPARLDRHLPEFRLPLSLLDRRLDLLEFQGSMFDRLLTRIDRDSTRASQEGPLPNLPTFVY